MWISGVLCALNLGTRAFGNFEDAPRGNIIDWRNLTAPSAKLIDSAWLIASVQPGKLVFPGSGNFDGNPQVNETVRARSRSLYSLT